MFSVYSNGIRLGDAFQRTNAEEMGKHWLTNSDDATGYRTVSIVDNPGVIVSVVTDDANGPQIHRLDDWEPSASAPCKHEIAGDIPPCVEASGGSLFLCFQCKLCNEAGRVMIEDFVNIKWGL